MDDEDLFAAFADFDPPAHEDEARERWGDTAMHAEARRRTEAYTKDDWLRHRREADEAGETPAALMDDGVPPGDPRAQAAAEQRRPPSLRRRRPLRGVHAQDDGPGHLGVAGGRPATSGHPASPVPQCSMT